VIKLLKYNCIERFAPQQDHLIRYEFEQIVVDSLSRYNCVGNQRDDPLVLGGPTSHP